MITIDLKQGSPEWHVHRKSHFNASDAPAMMGCGQRTRVQLLDWYKGAEEDVNSFKQDLFDKGHDFESLALDIAEQHIHDDLFPFVGVLDDLSASFDGITLCETVIYEHKTLNNDIINNGMSRAHIIQMQHQFIVSKAERGLFLATKWENGYLLDEFSCWVYPDLKIQKEILAGWEQFRKDLLTHQVKQKTEVLEKVSIEELPAIYVQVKGELTACNIADVRPFFDKFLAEATTDLVTDNDFAEAEAQSKVARDIAKKCVATEKSIIDQTASISEITRELRLYADKFNALALLQEKSVKTQKENIKREIISVHATKFEELRANLNAQISPVILKVEYPDFANALKNKRTIDSLESAANSELARVSALATTIANKVSENLVKIKSHSKYQFLFNDLNNLAYLEPEYLDLTLTARVNDHLVRLDKELEAAKLAERIEAERAEIQRAEIQRAKAERIEKERVEPEPLPVEYIEISEQQEPEPIVTPTDTLSTESILVRPERDEIIACLVHYFRCTNDQAIQWIKEF